jgi:hypothetical protein
MADAVAAFEHETVKTLGSTRLPSVQVETLKLKNIMNEIIPMNEWYFRSAYEAMVYHGPGIPCLSAQAEEQNPIGQRPGEP